MPWPVLRPRVNHDVRAVFRQTGRHNPRVRSGCDAQFSIVTVRQDVACGIGNGKRADGLRLVVGKVLARFEPDVEERTSVVRGSAGDLPDSRKAQEQRERERRLVEGRQDNGLVDPGAAHKVDQPVGHFFRHGWCRVDDPRALPRMHLGDAGQHFRGA